MHFTIELRCCCHGAMRPRHSCVPQDAQRDWHSGSGCFSNMAALLWSSHKAQECLFPVSPPPNTHNALLKAVVLEGNWEDLKKKKQDMFSANMFHSNKLGHPDKHFKVRIR